MREPAKYRTGRLRCRDAAHQCPRNDRSRRAGPASGRRRASRAVTIGGCAGRGATYHADHACRPLQSHRPAALRGSLHLRVRGSAAGGRDAASGQPARSLSPRRLDRLVPDLRRLLLGADARPRTAASRLVPPAMADGDDGFGDRDQLFQRERAGGDPAAGHRGRASVDAAAGGGRRLADRRHAVLRPGLRAQGRGLRLVRRDLPERSLPRLLEFHLRDLAGGERPGAGARGAAAPERRASGDPRAARRVVARQRAHAHLARAARPAGPPPDRAQHQPRGRLAPRRRQGEGARAEGTAACPPAAGRRPRGREPVAPGRGTRPRERPRGAGGRRARAPDPPVVRARLPRRRRAPGAGPAALRPGDDHEHDPARARRNLWLRFHRADDGALALDARDDGQGAAQWVAGNGLNGMRERLAKAEGTLEVRAAPGKGFELSIRVPQEVSA